MKLESKTTLKNKKEHKPKPNIQGRKISQILFKKFSTIIEGNQNQKKNDESMTNQEIKEENEEFPPRFLYPNDPNAPKVLITYNHLNNEIQRQEIISQLVIHFQHEGCTILKESDEYKQQEDIHQERQKKMRQIMQTHQIGGQDFLGYNTL